MKNREREIFERALDVVGEGERSSFVASACGGDGPLRQRVVALLGANEKAGTFLPEAEAGSRSGRFGHRALDAEGPGSLVGRYKLLEEIGEGGFGVVYLAEQREPVKRRVALKIIKQGMDTRQVVARFEAERQALAMMDHPNIARVLDAGATEAGRPYFVMELVRGERITDFCDRNRLATAERLGLFIRVCEAIQHAHQKGIVHRDIKPNNVLVALQDDRAVPKVIDFGIAKAIGHELTDKTVFTRAHEFLGTPAYMSPEQTDPGAVDIDTRSDIYSLGVLLYELLTGRAPFDPAGRRAGGCDDIRRCIREEEPVKPSKSLNLIPASDLARSARQRQADPEELRRALKGDLDWIVMKAIEKDRSRRYESASAFALDIARHLNEEPVAAVAPTLGYRLSKFARRHRAALAAASALGLVLLAGVLVSAGLAVRATRAERTALRLLETEQHARAKLDRTLAELENARQSADREARRARAEAENSEAVARFVGEELFAAADPESVPDRDLTLRAVLDRASTLLPSSLAGQPLAAASLHTTIGRAYRNLGLYTEAIAHSRAAYDLHLRMSGGGRESTLRAMIFHARALHSGDRRAEAISLLLEARESVLELFGPGHPLAVKCTGLLAWMRYRNRETGEAFRLAEEAYAAALETPGVDEADLFDAMHLAARRRGAREGGRFEDGEALIQRLMDLARARHGDDHLATARAKHNLAAFYYDSGQKLDDAERLYWESLAGYRRILGDSHDRTITARANLALLYELRQEPGAALRQYLTLLQFRPSNVRALDLLPSLISRAPIESVLDGANAALWMTTTNAPAANWNCPGFDASGWRKGAPAAMELWFRREFELTGDLARPLLFWIESRGDFDVFVNGVRAVEKFGTARGNIQLAVSTPDAVKALRTGRNVVAMHSSGLPLSGGVTIRIFRFPPELDRTTVLARATEPSN